MANLLKDHARIRAFDIGNDPRNVGDKLRRYEKMVVASHLACLSRPPARYAWAGVRKEDGITRTVSSLPAGKLDADQFFVHQKVSR